ncbi:MAG TPA: PLP-dependent aminotransferase family protein [Solirubrobacteraceae bacterium]|jgi:2-aminoadipate transaminase|nr:PLP-dependent aminotransferase family protein [Solirubrobacteraceae bacterium]
MTIDDPSGGGDSPKHGSTPKAMTKGHIPTGQARAGGRARPTAHELARYESLFAERTHGMRSSAMRDMMSLTERPEVISLAGGLPETKTFPPELYAKLMSKVAAESTARALQYGPTEGMACTVQCILQVMAEEGTAVDPDEVLVTTGGQQVIDLMCKAFIDPGDTIVAEAPTYPGAVPTFDAYQANVVQIEMDAEGMPIDELEATLDRLEQEGRSPKFIYTIPNFQNPGGVTMSLARRRRLVEVAREREILVLEDNPYGLLRYEGDPLPTLHSLDAAAAKRGGASDFVVYLGTFSKILSPGVRLGWAVAPRPILEKLNLCKQGADLCSSPVTQLFVAAYFEESTRGGARRGGGALSAARDEDEPLWLAHLDSLKALYRTRRDAMLDALAEHFGPAANWTKPQGGLFIWATLPEYIDTTDLLARALESEAVAFVPGRAAYLDGRGASSMRLNFAGVAEEDIREGIRRIGKVVREQVGLFGTLTGAEPARAERPVQHGDAGMAEVVELPRREQRGAQRGSH